MLDKDLKVEAMAKVPLFSRLSRRELARVAKLADEVDLRAGKVLATQGARAREFFVLLEGEAEVRRDTRLLPLLRAGDFFGEIGLVADVPRIATVTAYTPVRALVLTDRAFRDLMHHYPDIQRKVLETVACRLAQNAL